MKKIIALFLSCLMLTFLLAGCGAPAQTAATAPASSGSAAGATQVITDMAGRQVTIPKTVKSVYCAVPTAEAMITSLCPEKLIGVVNKPSKDALKYLSPDVANLPAIGGWMGQQVTANIENIVKLAPDVIIYMSTDIKTDQTPAQIQKQTNIPVIVVSSALADTAKAYRFLGQCLGVSDRAETLASYCGKIMTKIKDDVAKVPAADRVTVYYAESKGGLSTDPTGSNHTEVLDLINVKNVADVEKLAGQGMTSVSIEQVINWNPAVILVSGSTPANYHEILTNSSWKNIKAVQDGNVYLTPMLPYDWFDRPPDVMRIIASEWFANKIYPQYVKIDANSEIKNFFKLFYDVDLTDSQITALLAAPGQG